MMVLTEKSERMKVVITGAAGSVAGRLRPALERVHDCTWLDRLPARPGEPGWVVGDVLSPESIEAAMAGQDAVIQLVMLSKKQWDATGQHYMINVRGMATVLEAAVKHRVSRVIYASSMSVYNLNWKRRFETEDLFPDALDPYGLTKHLGEQVCRTFSAAHDWMSILALRMVLPCNEEKWERRASLPYSPLIATGPQDLRNLYLAALALEGHRGFDAINASSDVEAVHLNQGKAKALLGWSPRGE